MKNLLFPDLNVPRKPPRVIAHCIDGGVLDIVVPGKTEMGHFVCEKCGFDEWVPCTGTEGRRGIPCPNCNPKTGDEGEGDETEDGETEDGA